MPEPSTLAELRETLTRSEVVRSMISDPHDRAIYDVEIIELRKQIEELEKPDAAAFGCGAPYGGV